MTANEHTFRHKRKDNMIQVFTGNPGLGVCATLDAMHRDRKRIFVDLLKWNVPVVDHQYEVDQFDTANAVYLVEAHNDEHIGSIRLLRTDCAHLLGSLFPHLCDGEVPTGPDVMEITRGCISPRLRAAERLRVRNRLTTAAVEYGLRHGLSRFTCVADSGWLAQIPTLGWETRLLGARQRIAGVMTGALEIKLSSCTITRLRTSGSLAPSPLIAVDPLAPLAA